MYSFVEEIGKNAVKDVNYPLTWSGQFESLLKRYKMPNRTNDGNNDEEEEEEKEEE